MTKHLEEHDKEIIDFSEDVFMEMMEKIKNADICVSCATSYIVYLCLFGLFSPARNKVGEEIGKKIDQTLDLVSSIMTKAVNDVMNEEFDPEHHSEYLH